MIGSTAKIYKQKGMGRARHGSKKWFSLRVEEKFMVPNPGGTNISLTPKLKKMLLGRYLPLNIKREILKLLIS